MNQITTIKRLKELTIIDGKLDKLVYETLVPFINFERTLYNNQISEKNLELFIDVINWDRLSIWRPVLSIEFIRKYKDILDWSSFCHYSRLTESIIREFSDYVEWFSISHSQKLSYTFIDEYADKLDWDRMSHAQDLSLNLMYKYAERLNWDKISQYQSFPKSFWIKFRVHMDKNRIAENKKLPSKLKQEIHSWYFYNSEKED